MADLRRHPEDVAHVLHQLAEQLAECDDDDHAVKMLTANSLRNLARALEPPSRV